MSSLSPELKAALLIRLEAEKRRRIQCPNRSLPGVCSELSEVLGWKHGISLEECDTCWSLGGREGEAAQEFRARHVLLTISSLKDPKFRGKVPSHIVEGLVSHHCTPREASEMLEDPRTQLRLKLDDERRETWTTWQKAGSAFRSYKSRGIFDWKRAEPAVLALRQLSCFGSSSQPPCPALRTADETGGGKHYCGQCGCGERADAILDDEEYPKLAFPVLDCPMKKAGFSNSEVKDG